jgi:hypothetical protein
MPTNTTAKREQAGNSLELVQVFRVLAADYWERLKRYNNRGLCPLPADPEPYLDPFWPQKHLELAEKDPNVAAWTHKWLTESEAIDCHPIVWLCWRITELTGIDKNDLQEAATRINSGWGLGVSDPPEPFLHKYKRRDLNWIKPKLHELDRDGSTDRIVQELVTKYADHRAIAQLRAKFLELHPRENGEPAKKGAGADALQTDIQIPARHSPDEGSERRARQAHERAAADLSEVPTPVPNRPSDLAFQAWRLRDLKGLKGPTAIAEAMTKQLGHKVHQGTVSRYLQQVEAYRKAGGIFPDLSEPAEKPRPIDPALIDMGARVDRHTTQQRQRRDPDSE